MLCLELRIVKSFNVFIVFLTMVLISGSACYKNSDRTAFEIAKQNQLMDALTNFEIIGEGTDFLTIKIELPAPLSADSRFFVMALDESGFPLRKVSGYGYDPKLEGKNHYWFFLFLYAPQEWPEHLNRSKSLKFVYVENKVITAEKVLEYQKEWGGKNGPKVFDLPAPPDNISGFLLLKDYTFLARDEFRQPDGYYVEGTISGKNGRWSIFQALSDIKGQEPEPQFVLPSDWGWLELATGRTHSMREAISPQPPYVKGWWDGKGYFHPEPVKIFSKQE